MKAYNPQEIEPKWQKYWEENSVFRAVDFDKRPKKYVLDMFPYPSAAGLHVGHPEGYTATDIYARFLRMNGFNVLHPMGWDAFGLPAENYAIKTGTHPRKTTQENIGTFRRQIKTLGFSYDWEREIDTTDPNYYKWTQWIFLQLFKHGLAYEDTAPINFCPSCKTGLANEEVSNGLCERCGFKVERKTIRQWILKITKYADRLLKDLEKLDWPEPIKLMQKNWIGRSEGTNIKFKVKSHPSRPKAKPRLEGSKVNGTDSNYFIEVFTTRTDTLFGCTYLVIAPDSKYVEKLKESVSNLDEAEKYISNSKKKSDLERTQLQKDKTGVELKGVKAINPINNKEVSIWVADYILSSYGTGAVMAVPAHDERDFEFAKKYGIEIVETISPVKNEKLPARSVFEAADAGGKVKSQMKKAFVKYGCLINSAEFSGQDSKKAKTKITEKLKSKKAGDFAINYKLRDWIFSRQRYWGEPIPIIHCEKCGAVPVPEKDLPVKLPEVKKYEPSGTGDSPLVDISDWVTTLCPQCNGPAKRETNTMPQWAGSCWYYLRYIDSQNNNSIVDSKKEKYWMEVDLYVGGAEHAVLHLLYARFWHKFLFDIGVVSTDEPFQSLRNQGMILSEDGRKMSKSLGNVINPDDIVKKYGADTLRLYEMFMGPFDMVKKWDTKSIEGISRFLKKVFAVSQSEKYKTNTNEIIVNKTIKKVTKDIENFKFNTAISALMIMTNEMIESGPSKREIEILTILISPFAPHLAEEIWNSLGRNGTIYNTKWPEYNDSLIGKENVFIAVQINGKKRFVIETEPGKNKEEMIEKIFEYGIISYGVTKENLDRVIYVEDKIINLTTRK